jgi:hypothetical protein
LAARIPKNQKQIETIFDARASWGAPIEAQGEAVLRPYMSLRDLNFGGRSAS